MKSSNAKFAKSNYLQLSQLGSEFNLSFSSHLAIGNKLIALDGIKKKLLVSETGNGMIHTYIIHLDKISAISVKKCYGSIKSGELKKKGIEEFLKRIDLQFEYIDDREQTVLTFYDCEIDDLRDLPILERNAKNWQMILSKMISRKPSMAIVLFFILVGAIALRDGYIASLH